MKSRHCALFYFTLKTIVIFFPTFFRAIEKRKCRYVDFKAFFREKQIDTLSRFHQRHLQNNDDGNELMNHSFLLE